MMHEWEKLCAAYVKVDKDYYFETPAVIDDEEVLMFNLEDEYEFLVRSVFETAMVEFRDIIAIEKLTMARYSDVLSYPVRIFQAIDIYKYSCW